MTLFELQTAAGPLWPDILAALDTVRSEVQSVAFAALHEEQSSHAHTLAALATSQAAHDASQASLAEHQALAAEATVKAGEKIAALAATIQQLGAEGVNIAALVANLHDLIAVASEVSMPVIDRQRAALDAEIARLTAVKAAFPRLPPVALSR